MWGSFLSIIKYHDEQQVTLRQTCALYWKGQQLLQPQPSSLIYTQKLLLYWGQQRLVCFSGPWGLAQVVKGCGGFVGGFWFTSQWEGKNLPIKKNKKRETSLLFHMLYPCSFSFWINMQNFEEKKKKNVAKYLVLYKSWTTPKSPKVLPAEFTC